MIPALPKFTELPSKNTRRTFEDYDQGYQFGAEKIAGYFRKIERVHPDKNLKPVNFRSTIEPVQLGELSSAAAGDIEITKNRLQSFLLSTESFTKTRDYYLLGLHQPYSWAFICIVFIFIGTSMGSIIRKGGYGFPVLFAILFFMSFIVFNTMGDRLVRSGKMAPVLAAWLPVLALSPISILLTIMAIRDTKIGKIQWPFKRSTPELVTVDRSIESEMIRHEAGNK